jgi:FkbM family methyltransferase
MNISHFSARVLNKLRLLPKVNSSVTIRVNQRTFKIPLLGRQGYDNLDLSEPWMTQVLLALRPLFKGDFVDVGVNLGQTLLKAHAVFGEVNYIGFEPNPSCVNYVQEMVRQNELKNFLILPIAIGAKTEVLKLNFFAADKSDSSASIIENFKQNTVPDHFIFVPVFDNSLFERFLPSRNHSILKIDVEGAEMEVLLGLNDWIKSYHPIILLEILPVYSPENLNRLNRQNKIEDLARAWGYKIGRIKKTDPVKLETIENIGIHSKIEDCDYVLYHEFITQEITSCFNTTGKTPTK